MGCRTSVTPLMSLVLSENVSGRTRRRGCNWNIVGGVITRDSYKDLIFAISTNSLIRRLIGHYRDC